MLFRSKDKRTSVPEINTALEEKHYVIIPKSLWSMFSDQINIPSHSIVTFEEGTMIFSGTPSDPNVIQKCLFSFDGVENVTFIGNGMRVFINKDTNSSEIFPAMCIKGSKNIFIMDFGIVGSNPGGIIISGGTKRDYSENIEIKNVMIENANNAFVLQSVKSLKAYKVIVKHSSDKGKGASIRISGKTSKDVLEDIYLENLVTERNRDSALEINPNVDQLVLTIKDYESRRDGGRAPIFFIQSSNNGKVVLDNLSISNDDEISVIFKGWNTNDCMIEIIDPKLNWKSGFLYGIDEEDVLYTNLDQLKIQR